MKINNLIEKIFSQAVALDQSGGLRNTIFASDRNVFIMNYDHTVLLRFRLSSSEGQFSSPIAFKANDYDSNEFEQADGKIIFTSKNGEYVRKKVCGTSEITPDEVKEIFNGYMADDSPRVNITLNRDVLTLLDEELSHIEFTGEKGGTLKMIQRNIYSGGIIEIEKVNDGLLKEELSYAFGPVAIKTDDFKALFTFQEALKFSFPLREKSDTILIKNASAQGQRDMMGVIACCLYDEIIEIQAANANKDTSTKQPLKRSK